MDVQIVIAIIGAVVSTSGAIIAGFFALRNGKTLASYSARLEESKAEKDAQRDYKYEAKKRLYTECEPLFFLLNELSENAYYRIMGLARAARDEKIGKWLDHEGYYLRSTAYFLIAPLSIYKLLQRRLTSVDISVDSKTRVRYELIKSIAWTFTDDFVFAKINPKLIYDPYDIAVFDTIKPQEHRKQGLPLGPLDNAIESLIIDRPGNATGYMSFGEFEQQFQTEGSRVRQSFLPIKNILLNFHPENQPILWRILITQAHLYLALEQACNRKVGENCLDFMHSINESQRKPFDWRANSNQASEKSVLVDPFDVATFWMEEYFKKDNWLMAK